LGDDVQQTAKLPSACQNPAEAKRPGGNRRPRHVLFEDGDESLEESDNLPDPDVLAQEIVEDREAALEQFREIAAQ